MKKHRLSFALEFGMLVLGSGCAGEVPIVPEPTWPLFIPTSHDMKQLAVLSNELDTAALTCVEDNTCDRVHYARALVSLFENRESAAASFRHVIDHNGRSPLAASSMLWLRVMEEEQLVGGEQSTSFNDISAQFVRDWMEGQVIVSSQRSEALKKANVAVDVSRLVKSLEKEVRERHRRISVLESQLAALKLIDQKHADRKRPLKTPTTVPERSGSR